MIAGGLVPLEALRVTLDALRTEMAQDPTILQSKENVNDIIVDAAREAKVHTAHYYLLHSYGFCVRALSLCKAQSWVVLLLYSPTCSALFLSRGRQTVPNLSSPRSISRTSYQRFWSLQGKRIVRNISSPPIDMFVCHIF